MPQRRNIWRPLLALFILGLLLALAIEHGRQNHLKIGWNTSFASSARNQSPNSAKKDPDLAQRDYMIQISEQLGVTCAYCHDVKNYRSSDMKTWQVSKKHIEAVQLLNEKFPGQIGKVVDCYTCHKGQAKFEKR